MKIVKAIQTCSACPAQWDAWDEDGQYWYLRFRYGKGTATHYDSSDYETWDRDYAKGADYSFTIPGEPLLGIIELEEFCEKAGIELAEYCVRHDLEWD